MSRQNLLLVWALWALWICPVLALAAQTHQGNEVLRLEDKLIFVSTLSGWLRAVDPWTGELKWSLKEEPVVRVPVDVRAGFTFLPDPQDGSLYLLREGRLKKLPLTIPQLVHASPCKSSDGVLYAGSKKDVWIGLDMKTGQKLEMLSQDSGERVCPATQGSGRTVFIGRTEYSISMFEGVNRERRWNGTFMDYSSHALPEDLQYGLLHYASSSDGRVLTVDGDDGHVLWERDLGAGSPVVALYILEGDGLHRLPFTLIGNETLASLIQNSGSGEGGGGPYKSRLLDVVTDSKKLYQTLYVGETEHGLYALPSLVDESTVTILPSYLGPALIEGPAPLASHPSAESTTHTRPHVTPNLARAQAKKGAKVIIEEGTGNVYRLEELEDEEWNVFRVAESWWYSESRQSLVLLLSLATTTVLSLAFLFMHCRQAPPSMSGGRLSGSGSRSRRSGWFGTREEVPEGWIPIGKILFDQTAILGRGCEGTVVYRGRFDGRDVAVKRVVSDFINLADREVHLLRESDTHANVIRYFCMEADSQFRYIALELCWGTLSDWVDKAELRLRCALKAPALLAQATHGLAHLHSLKIVHRDIKPQNVLFTGGPTGGEARVVISDFGLCKKLEFGRNSVSRRSGVTGTDGWIAPEVLATHGNVSVTTAVDIFSLGCVYYYVVSLGHHPFGDSLRRQANIISNQYTLADLAADANLVTEMVGKEPSERPPAKSVLAHPFFWDAAKILAFFQEVSDRVEKEDASSPVLRALDFRGRSVVHNDWRQHICPALQADLRKFRTYRGNSVRDLLRALRNKKHHYRELPEEVRTALGSVPDGIVAYFTTRFPRLLVHAYEAMKVVGSERPFHPFYHQTHSASAPALLSNPVPTPVPPPDPPDTWEDKTDVSIERIRERAQAEKEESIGSVQFRPGTVFSR